MVGWSETDEEVLQVLRDCAHDINILTISQYLAPSTSHLPVRHVPRHLRCTNRQPYDMGFTTPPGALALELPRRRSGQVGGGV